MMRTIANNHSALSSSSFSNVPLELLAGRSVGKYVLHKSVPVEVHASEYDVSLYVPSLEEYGWGETLESALADLLSSLSDTFDYLKAHENELAPPEQRKLGVFRETLLEVGSESHASGWAYSGWAWAHGVILV